MVIISYVGFQQYFRTFVPLYVIALFKFIVLIYVTKGIVQINTNSLCFVFKNNAY